MSRVRRQPARVASLSREPLSCPTDHSQSMSCRPAQREPRRRSEQKKIDRLMQSCCPSARSAGLKVQVLSLHFQADCTPEAEKVQSEKMCFGDSAGRAKKNSSLIGRGQLAPLGCERASLTASGVCKTPSQAKLTADSNSLSWLELVPELGSEMRRGACRSGSGRLVDNSTRRSGTKIGASAKFAARLAANWRANFVTRNIVFFLPPESNAIALVGWALSPAGKPSAPPSFPRRP